MSADAASLSCPICLHTGVFNSIQALKDRLIYVSTNNILCPVCQEPVSGLDKLTIHLFSHLSIVASKGSSRTAENRDGECNISKQGSQGTPAVHLKKTRTTGAKNKTIATTAPLKYVKIYPKLPVIALNTVPVIDISQGSAEGSLQVNNSVYIPTTIKSETTHVQSESKCNVCGIRFLDADILRMHKCLIHNLDETQGPSSTSHNCHLCPKKFKMRGSLMVHLRVAHLGFLSVNAAESINSNTNNNNVNTSKQEDKLINVDKNDGKQWQCDVCCKCFTTKYFLKKHKRLHTGETPYACNQCNKTFTFQQSYHKHLLYHNDEKPHTCNYCGRAFKELSTLHNHQRIHTGEKPFSCETCGKSFRQRVSYLVHRRIHTGAMPYKCTACEKSFRYKVSQRTHKCQSRPPGTVIRQTSNLVQKLKKKYDADDSTNTCLQEISQNASYIEVSEANAELVRTGAKLSLEDMESDNFMIITENFNEYNNSHLSGSNFSEQNINNEISEPKNIEIFESHIEELIDSLPEDDKNIPSPSDIFKNLCLTNDNLYPSTH